MKIIFSILLAAILSSSCAQKSDNAVTDPVQQQKDEEIILRLLKEAEQTEAQHTASGIYYIVQEPGTGVQPNSGDRVSVRYEGRFTDGSVFDGTKNNASFRFKAGIGEVISGWDESVLLMKEGEKTTFYIPSHLAYGKKGAGRVIPPNAVLVFDIELIKVH